MLAAAAWPRRRAALAQTPAAGRMAATADRIGHASRATGVRAEGLDDGGDGRGGTATDRAMASRPGAQPPGTPLLVEYSKCSASPGKTRGWIACAAIAASLKPCRISFSFPG